MDFISASFASGHNQSTKDLIASVARHNGFFEAKGDKPNLDSCMSTRYVLEALMSGKGGTIYIEMSHPDFQELRDKAAFEWHDKFRYEFLYFGRQAGFCVECRGELERADDTYQTCYDCMWAIMEDCPIEPRPLAKKFIKIMTAWHTRHGNDEAIEQLKALM